MQQVMEYVRQNPTATPVDIICHFESVLEIPKQIEFIKTEAIEYARLKASMRPLFGQRLEVEEKMRYALSDIEGEIFLEYPPRKGSDAQRETMRNKLKQSHPNFLSLQKEFNSFTQKIQDVEEDLKILDMNTKNARRLTELFGNYVSFINEFMKNPF